MSPKPTILFEDKAELSLFRQKHYTLECILERVRTEVHKCLLDIQREIFGKQLQDEYEVEYKIYFNYLNNAIGSINFGDYDQDGDFWTRTWVDIPASDVIGVFHHDAVVERVLSYLKAGYRERHTRETAEKLAKEKLEANLAYQKARKAVERYPELVKALDEAHKG